MRSMRHWLAERGVWWHAQNLSGDWPTSDPSGPLWRHGRAWLRFDGERRRGRRPLLGGAVVNPEWGLGRWGGIGASLTLGTGDSDRGVSLYLGVPGASVSLSVEPLPWVERILPGYWIDRGGVCAANPQPYHQHTRPVPNGVKITEPHEIGVSVHSGGVWWRLWHSTMSWSSRTPRWRHGEWMPLDTLLGRQQHTAQTVAEHEGVEIPMPEGTYRASVRLTLDRWRRPRWPRPLVVRRAHVEIADGLPVPGKGENTWDCGEDAIYGLTTQASTLAEAIGATVASAMRDRLRHGGAAWRPERRATAS